MGKEIKPHQPEYWDDKLPNLAAAMRSMGIRASDKIPSVGIYHAFYNGDHVIFQVHDGGFRIINYHGEKNDAPKLNLVKYLDESPESDPSNPVVDERDKRIEELEKLIGSCKIGPFEHNKSIFNLGQCHSCYKTKTIE